MMQKNTWELKPNHVEVHANGKEKGQTRGKVVNAHSSLDAYFWLLQVLKENQGKGKKRTKPNQSCSTQGHRQW